MCIQEYVNLYNESVALRLSKSIFIPALRVQVTRDIQYVKNQSFIANWFGEKRPYLHLK
jgi:hypothetical protein